MSACHAAVELSMAATTTATTRKSHRLGPTRATRRTKVVSARIAKSGRRAVRERNIRKPAATRKIVTPELPLRKNGRTHAWWSIQSMGHKYQPWESTTSTIAMPRSPSYRSTRRCASAAVSPSAGGTGAEVAGEASTGVISDMTRTVVASGAGPACSLLGCA